jgi:hypothetical protein
LGNGIDTCPELFVFTELIPNTYCNNLRNMGDPPSPTLSAIDLPDLTELKGLVVNMKDTLVTLASSFQNLGKQTADVAGLKPEFDAAHQVIIIPDTYICMCNTVFRLSISAEN